MKAGLQEVGYFSTIEPLTAAALALGFRARRLGARLASLGQEALW